MAALDFPSSPTTGQIFVGGNGVSYQYNGVLWLASGASAGGDFCALLVGPAGLPTTLGDATTMPVISGNLGGWYVPGTGTYTPPAGRFYIFASMTVFNGSAGTLGAVVIMKNGVGLNASTDTTSAVNNYANPSTNVTVDANGTDVFKVQVQGSAASSTGTNITFGAFPISGIKGPPGDAGTALAQNAQTGNYTLVLGDANGHIYHAVAAATATYTIPANASVAYPLGTTLSFVNDSVNNVTIAITTDTLVLSPGTTTGSRTLATGGVATALKVTSTRWIINGTGLT